MVVSACALGASPTAFGLCICGSRATAGSWQNSICCGVADHNASSAIGAAHLQVTLFHRSRLRQPPMCPNSPHRCHSSRPSLPPRLRRPFSSSDTSSTRSGSKARLSLARFSFSTNLSHGPHLAIRIHDPRLARPCHCTPLAVAPPSAKTLPSIRGRRGCLWCVSMRSAAQ